MKNKLANTQDKLYRLIALCAVLSAVIIAANVVWVGGSSIESPYTLAHELNAQDWRLPPAALLEQWVWKRDAPYRYRILGKFAVVGLYHVLAPFVEPYYVVYYAFVWCSFIFLCLALLAFAYLISVLFQQLEHGASMAVSHEHVAISACVLFALCPPIACAFKFPVHTDPNDLLGYFFISAAVAALLKDRIILFCVIVSVSVFCRETCLIVLAVLLFDNRYTFGKRMLVATMPIGLLIAYRLSWYEAYNPLAGARHNFAYPFESLGFLILVFGVLWFAAIKGYLDIRRFSTHRLHPLFASFPWSALLTLSIIVFLARVREIRLEFILFFQVIPLALMWWYHNRIMSFLIRREYWIYLGSVSILVSYLWFHRYPESIEEQARLGQLLQYFYYADGWSIYGGKSGSWVELFLIQLALILAIQPFLFKNGGRA